MRKELICASIVIALAAAHVTALDRAQSTSAQQKPQVKTTPTAPLATPAEAKLIAEFDARVKAYAELRDKVDEGKARQTATKEPEKLTAQRDTLRANIQKARAGAKHGDIFSPHIQSLFKKLLNPAVKGKEGPENKNTIKEEKPAVWLRVNAPYPEDQPLSTVPPDVLMQLPALPKDIEYRFVQRHLLLYDSRASLIIDFIYNAIP